MAQPGELFVMARVPEAIREALLRVLADAGMDTTLGRALYPPRNWHQSLSDLHPAAAREHLRLACSRLEARAIAPVPWQIDAVELVEVAGRGADYRYEVVDTFPLRPAARPDPTQPSLLD